LNNVFKALGNTAAVCFVATAASLAQTPTAPAKTTPAPIAKTATAAPAPVKAAAPTSVTPLPATSPPPAIPLNRGIIFLDPAHGAVDSGSRISDSLLEKDVTLSFAFKLRSLLAARGFSISITRDSDVATESNSPTPLTLDDRAGLANHAHPVACLLLHATASGSGVHLYSSELDPTPNQPAANPWLTAQAPWVTQSQRLEKNLGQALTRASIPLVMSRASIRPVDSLTCPALVIELAPNGGDATSVNDADYQQRIAEAIATSLVLWKSQAQPPDPAPVAIPAPVPPTGAKP
jgi:N-acetylmuramoyl-L-alanine amidase